LASIDVDNINKNYHRTVVLQQVSLAINDGEFMTLVGPSGCGKSTLLRIIAGLESQSDGDVRIDGVSVNGVRPSDRNLSMVFQSYALYPHLNVFDNIAVPLRMRHHNPLQRLPMLRWLIPGTRRNESAIRDQVVEVAQSLGLGELLARKPGELSGGQRQRVAVGRAIVRDPKGFLLDEPLSNLDAKMRVHMRTELTQLHRRLGATFIYVTHDQAEAMTMSDRIAVMMDGEIIQIGTPNEVYHRPVDIRVAEFIGSPKINVLPANPAADGKIEIAGCATRLGGNSDVVSVGIRPEACQIVQSTSNDSEDVVLRGVTSHLENFGAEVFLHVQLANINEPLVIRSEALQAQSIATGDTVTVKLDLSRLIAFDAGGQVVDVAAVTNVQSVGADAISSVESAIT